MTQQESQKIPERPRTINILEDDNIPNCDKPDGFTSHTDSRPRNEALFDRRINI